jgi:hypothetical protein
LVSADFYNEKAECNVFDLVSQKIISDVIASFMRVMADIQSRGILCVSVPTY